MVCGLGGGREAGTAGRSMCGWTAEAGSWLRSASAACFLRAAGQAGLEFGRTPAGSCASWGADTRSCA